MAELNVIKPYLLCLFSRPGYWYTGSRSVGSSYDRRVVEQLRVESRVLEPGPNKIGLRGAPCDKRIGFSGEGSLIFQVVPSHCDLD